LAAISHVFTTYVAEMVGEDEDWLHELSIDIFPEDGCLYVEPQRRCRNRLHRGRHRELETDHRRHASRRPRAPSKTFNGVSIPRCSPEAYTTITDRGYGFPGSWPSLGFGLAPE